MFKTFRTQKFHPNSISTASIILFNLAHWQRFPNWNESVGMFAEIYAEIASDKVITDDENKAILRCI